jgi:aspartate racemase
LLANWGVLEDERAGSRIKLDGLAPLQEFFTDEFLAVLKRRDCPGENSTKERAGIARANLIKPQPVPVISRTWIDVMNPYQRGKVTNNDPRTFGLVAGLGVGAGIFYYKSLVDAHLARGLSPNLLMVHADVRRVMRLANERKAQELAQYLSGLLRSLADGGAELATIPAFSPQICASELAEMTPLPLISLLDAIAAEIHRRSLQRVAVFGARVTMETGLFGTLHGCDVIGLSSEETDVISNAYTRIVEDGKASPADREQLRSFAHRVIERDNVDAIVLAGTDLSFVFDESNTDFPHVDGARVHIKAIMDELLPTGADFAVLDTAKDSR